MSTLVARHSESALHAVWCSGDTDEMAMVVKRDESE